MRSDKWDEDDKNEPFDGLVRKPGDCKHYFDDLNRCVKCNKTMEELRKDVEKHAKQWCVNCGKAMNESNSDVCSLECYDDWNTKNT